jgi:tight adherence protein B
MSAQGLAGALPLFALRACSVAVAGGAGGVVLFLLLRTKLAFVRARLDAHQASIASEVAFLRLSVASRRLVAAQGAVAGVAVLLVLCEAWLSASLMLLCCAALSPILQVKRSQRTTQIESQLDAWLRLLASTLRTTPALGDALAQSARLLPAPMSEELDLIVREMQLGIALDHALERASARIRSRTVQSAFAAVRLGRRTGGELSDVLERSAGTLREMARLDGVLRTRTAESKAQAFVLSLLPFPLLALLHALDPQFLMPLFVSVRGYLVLAAAAVLWLLSIVLARRILHVDF